MNSLRLPTLMLTWTKTHKTSAQSQISVKFVIIRHVPINYLLMPSTALSTHLRERVRQVAASHYLPLVQIMLSLRTVFPFALVLLAGFFATFANASKGPVITNKIFFDIKRGNDEKLGRSKSEASNKILS